MGVQRSLSVEVVPISMLQLVIHLCLLFVSIILVPAVAETMAVVVIMVVVTHLVANHVHSQITRKEIVAIWVLINNSVKQWDVVGPLLRHQTHHGAISHNKFIKFCLSK